MITKHAGRYEWQDGKWLHFDRKTPKKKLCGKKKRGWQNDVTMYLAKAEGVIREYDDQYSKHNTCEVKLVNVNFFFNFLYARTITISQIPSKT